MISTTKQSKRKQKSKNPEQKPSANWLALQKKFSKNSKVDSTAPPRKRRRIESVRDVGMSEAGSSSRDDAPASAFPSGRDPQASRTPDSVSTRKTVTASGRESLYHLQRIILGQVEYSEEHKQPGKYLALDCEMVGVGPEGIESSLARVSLVNYHGAIILDEFVRQRERVADYRTAVSGVRAENMVDAIPFQTIQKRVAELLKDRILVGHAINNDLKALLLSQPRYLIRDTQLCAGKARLLKTKYPALRKLTQQELGMAIQAGEHSSVTDARAAMALYRLHRKEWDKSFRTIPNTSTSPKALGKRKLPAEDEDEDEAESEIKSSIPSKTKSSRKEKMKEAYPGGGRRGISSGLSTVVKYAGERVKEGKVDTKISENSGVKDKWWATLGSVTSTATVQRGSKGTMRIS